MEQPAGRMGGRSGEKAFDPVFGHIQFIGGGCMAGAHHQHIPYGHGGDPGMYIRRRLIREMFDNPVGEGEFSFFGEKCDRNGGETFADGEHAVQGIRLTGCVITFGNQPVPVQKKEAVHGDSACFKTV